MTDAAEVNRDWQRGVLATCALALLEGGEAHGYALAQRLAAAGLGPVKGGALYPVLNRLEEDGAVTSTWREGDGGPGRKVFGLTDEGRTRLAALRAAWGPFARAVGGVLGIDVLAIDDGVVAGTGRDERQGEP